MTTQDFDIIKVNQIIQKCANGDDANFAFNEADESVIGPADNLGCSKHPLYFKGAYNPGRKDLDCRAWQCVTASDISSKGGKFTAYGTGSIALNKSNTRSYFQISTGTGAIGSGGVLEFPNFVTQFAGFDYLKPMLQTPSNGYMQLDFGLWDGTQNNCIMVERYDGASAGVWTISIYISGTRTTYVASTIHGDTNRWQFELIKDTNTSPNTLRLAGLDPANAGTWTEFTNTNASMPTVDMWPFIRFETTQAGNNRTLTMDQNLAGANL